MKRFFTIFAILAAIVMTTGCIEFNFGDDKYKTETIDVTFDDIAGKSFGQQPYGGTAWGDNLWEIVTFQKDSIVTLSVGALDEPKTRYYGTYSCDGTKAVNIDGLQVFDRMSGTRYHIVRAEVGVMKSGALALYLGYDNGSGLQWDVALAYTELQISLDPTVQGWDPETTILGDGTKGGEPENAGVDPTVTGWENHYTTIRI